MTHDNQVIRIKTKNRVDRKKVKEEEHNTHFPASEEFVISSDRLERNYVKCESRAWKSFCCIFNGNWSHCIQFDRRRRFEISICVYKILINSISLCVTFLSIDLIQCCDNAIPRHTINGQSNKFPAHNIHIVGPSVTIISNWCQ